MPGARAHVNQGVAISTSSVFLFFQHERNPFLQIISPDLSVTVFVTLRYLTLTLSAPKRHRLTVRPNTL